VVDDFEGAHQAHLAVAGLHEFAHCIAREARLALRVREELDGRDVGVGVGHAAGHERARIGLRLADLAQARHEVRERADVERKPDDEGPHQLRIEHAHQDDHGRDIHAHGHQHVGQHEDGVAHRERGLHHLGRDAARELVLVEGHALAQHQPVEVPAQAHR
jgi:hypothetical protein